MKKKDLTIQEIKDISEHHKNIFGTIETIDYLEYIDIKYEMLNFIDFFDFLDDNFKCDLIKLQLQDVLSLINFINNPLEKFILNNNEEKKEMETLTKELTLLIGTKLYYLDLFTWEKIRNSSVLQNFIRNRCKVSVFSFIELFKNMEKKKTLLKKNFKIDNSNIRIEYKEEELEFLKKLDYKSFDIEDDLIKKLINSKKNISFFKDMQDEDIKAVVKDIKFIKYNLNERIIKEGENTKEVYFIISGKCFVKKGTRKVGTIEQNQLFGEFSHILNEKRSASVIANEVTTVLKFNIAFELFAEEPYPFSILYKNIINELIKKIKNSNRLL